MQEIQDILNKDSWDICTGICENGHMYIYISILCVCVCVRKYVFVCPYWKGDRYKECNFIREYV